MENHLKNWFEFVNYANSDVHQRQLIPIKPEYAALYINSIRPEHTALYLFLCYTSHKTNGSIFNITPYLIMEATGIKTLNTCRKVLRNLEYYGFIQAFYYKNKNSLQANMAINVIPQIS